ncbi:hypothetical protein [Fodinicola acaciae]|uniref:hypothetical protein n=1 Tax=Fodinicola acaciae TaxID=2681555 RepID=UPI0013CFB88E|nr:hypothetical protein [Fodinicola acaciae]
MRKEFADALAVVMRDLETTGVPRPDVRDDPWSDVPDAESVMLYGPDGSGAGVGVDLRQPMFAQVAAIADKVQEWVVEELWSRSRSTSWPECPAHPHTHPLEPAADGDRAVWRCPATKKVVAQIGALRLAENS